MGLTTEVKASAAGANGAVQWNDNGTLNADPGTGRTGIILKIDNTTGAGNEKITIGAASNTAGDNCTTILQDRQGVVKIVADVNGLCVGTSAVSTSAGLEVQGTTRGIRTCSVTTAEKNAMTGVSGLIVFDTTLAKLCVYSGAAWRTVTDT